MIVTGESSANAYEYPAGSTATTTCRRPAGKYYRLHKVRFCWDDEQPARRRRPRRDTPAPRRAAGRRPRPGARRPRPR